MFSIGFSKLLVGPPKQMSVSNPGMSLYKIKTYWEKRSNFYRLLMFFNFKNVFVVVILVYFIHGFYCVQKIWPVASSFAV